MDGIQVRQHPLAAVDDRIHLGDRLPAKQFLRIEVLVILAVHLVVLHRQRLDAQIRDVRTRNRLAQEHVVAGISRVVGLDPVSHHSEFDTWKFANDFPNLGFDQVVPWVDLPGNDSTLRLVGICWITTTQFVGEIAENFYCCGCHLFPCHKGRPIDQLREGGFEPPTFGL